MRRSETKDAIALALFRLMEGSSFESVSVKAICEAAGCNRSSFYRNFDSKEDVLQHRILMVMDEHLANFAKERKKSFEVYLECVFLAIQDNAKVFIELRHREMQGTLVKAVHSLFDSECDLNLLSVEEQYMMAFHIGGIANHIDLWLQRGMIDPPKEMAHMIAKGYPSGFIPMRARLRAASKHQTRTNNSATIPSG